jgi:hypothetical protein
MKSGVVSSLPASPSFIVVVSLYNHERGRWSRSPPLLSKCGLLLLLYSYLAVLDAVSSFTISRHAPNPPPHRRRRPTLAVLLSISGLLLLYSAAVVPFQICMWDYSDPCNTFPTLRFDVCVDTFFMVLYHTYY